MKFADLPLEMQNAINTVTNSMRIEAGTFSAMAHRLRAQVDNSGTKLIKQVIESLDEGEVIPNNTGLPGAVQLSKHQWLLLYSTADSVADMLTPEVSQACNDGAGPWKSVGQ